MYWVKALIHAFLLLCDYESSLIASTVEHVIQGHLNPCPWPIVSFIWLRKNLVLLSLEPEPCFASTQETRSAELWAQRQWLLFRATIKHFSGITGDKRHTFSLLFSRRVCKKDLPLYYLISVITVTPKIKYPFIITTHYTQSSRHGLIFPFLSLLVGTCSWHSDCLYKMSTVKPRRKRKTPLSCTN